MSGTSSTLAGGQGVEQHLNNPGNSSLAHNEHVLNSSSAHLFGLGIDQTPRQNVQFRPLIKETPNFARPLGPLLSFENSPPEARVPASSSLHQVEVVAEMSPPFLFGWSNQRLRRKAQASRSESVGSSPAITVPHTPSMSPAISDTSSSPFQYSSSDSMPPTPLTGRESSADHYTGHAFNDGYESPTPVRFRPLSYMHPRVSIPQRGAAVADSDYDSDESDREDQMEFFSVSPFPSTPSNGEPQAPSKPFAGAMAKLTSPSLLSLGISRKQRPSDKPVQQPVYRNRRAMATTANVLHIQREPELVQQSHEVTAGPSSVAELKELRASIEALAVTRHAPSRLSQPKQIKRKAVPVYDSQQAERGVNVASTSIPSPCSPSLVVSPRNTSPLMSSKPGFKEHRHPGRTGFVDPFASPDNGRIVRSNHIYRHSRKKSAWSSSSSETERSGSSSDKDSVIRTPPASAYDSSAAATFAYQQASRGSGWSANHQYNLDVDHILRRQSGVEHGIQVSPFNKRSSSSKLDSPMKKSGFSLSSVSNKFRKRKSASKELD